MTASLKDIDQVLAGREIPEPQNFGGLIYMPDVDFNSRQHQPLLVLSKGKVFYRKNLSKIKILSPTEYEALRNDPEKHDYKELTSKWAAFRLVTKLRLFPYIYNGTIVPVTNEKLAEIIADERKRNPQRAPIPTPTCIPEEEPTVFDWRTNADWRTNKDQLDVLDGLKRHSILRFHQNSSTQEERIENLNEFGSLTIS
ncbi:hypothetical protein [Legionella norrlandica]|uniref:hypothetical protein n=1 Tax=Legionella norrlandica TaxID=1498499 RepID=UPI000AEAD3CC|nr:hypothetical protein [Legionella norrlandica]